MHKYQTKFPKIVIVLLSLNSMAFIVIVQFPININCGILLNFVSPHSRRKHIRNNRNKKNQPLIKVRFLSETIFSCKVKYKKSILFFTFHLKKIWKKILTTLLNDQKEKKGKIVLLHSHLFGILLFFLKIKNSWYKIVNDLSVF